MSTIMDLPTIPRMMDFPSICSRTLRSCFAQDPEATLSDLGNGSALLVGAKASVTLDVFATQVWRALDGRAAATIPQLTARFAPNGDDLHVPTRRFIYQLLMALLARGLIHVVETLPIAAEFRDLDTPPEWWLLGE